MKITVQCVLVSILIFSISIASFGQQKIEVGIKWTDGLSWLEVREKARKENKYIFLDCFTTWCGPCKQMDKNVYTDEKVGEYFNSHFISVKVQMDKTKNDNGHIIKWYQDAEDIGERYMIEGYPSYLFFSPEGSFVHKEAGVVGPDSLITLARTALTPGKRSEDVYAKYDRLLRGLDYGSFNYEDLPFLVTMAKKKGDTVSRKILRVHEAYVSQLPKKKRYTKENILFWSTLNLTPDRNIIKFFYKDRKLIDKVMGREGYASRQVDRSIQSFIAGPFIFNNLSEENDVKRGVTTLSSLSDGATMSGIPIDSALSYRFDEANWRQLEKLIRKSFDGRVTKRNMIKAKAIWYEKNSNWLEFARYRFLELRIVPPDFNDWSDCNTINETCWNTFLNVNDRRLINEAIYWMEELVKSHSKCQSAEHFDTYANLLYKSGRKDDAIHWQQIAVNTAERTDENPGVKIKALEQMKEGKPTYRVQPLTGVQ